MAIPLTPDDRLARDVTRQKRVKALAWSLGALAAATIIILLVYLLVSIRATQINGTPTGKAILETNDSLKSCLEPSGKCYKESRDNQVKILGTISDRTVYAIRCAQEMPDAPVREVLDCVDTFVKQEKP